MHTTHSLAISCSIYWGEMCATHAPLPCTPPMHAPCHTCPLPCMPPTMHTPPAIHTAPAMHAPCHNCHLPYMPPATNTPPAMHVPLPHTHPAMHAPAMHTPSPCMPPCHECPLPHMPPLWTECQMPVKILPCCNFIAGSNNENLFLFIYSI